MTSSPLIVPEQKVYSFSDKLKLGQDGEDYLDKYYSNFYRIKKDVGMDLQKRGVDRVFCSLDSNVSCWFSVEYKVDFKAGETGNVFVEIEINRSGVKQFGWAQKLFAQSLLYYIPKHGKCYFCSALLLKLKIEQWLMSCRISNRVVNSENGQSWSALGVLVPIERFVQDVCIKVDDIRAANTPMEHHAKQ